VIRRRGGVLPLLAIGASALALSGCALGLQSLPKINASSGPSYPVHAVFADVLNLPEDAQVRVGAEVVGRVSSITTQDFQADLTLSINDGVQLLTGTTAQVRFDDPLGDEYVILAEPPAPAGAAAGPFLQAGATIPETSTSTAPTVEDTFGALSLVLNGGGLNQLQTIIRELNDTFDGNQPQIRSFLTTIDRAVRTIAGGKAAVDGALTAINQLTSQLNSGRSVIGNGIQAIAPAVGVLASENSQIQQLLGALSNLGAVGTQVAQQSGENSVQDLKDLLPVVQQLGSISQQIGPDLQDLAKFETESPKLAPGGYLQVNVIADVLLPAGAFEPGSFGTSSAQSGPAQPATGGQAVTDLLGTGLT
jgi:phospholipid/cholesterol/gamma-HCH transport system substrate-binding protein